MLGIIFEISLLFIISFLPILLWAYVFSYIDDNPINKSRFGVGILGGILSVFPILYMDKILDFFSLEFLNVFFYIHKISNLLDVAGFSLSLSFFLLLLVAFSFIFGLFVYRFKKTFIVYMKNILVFFVFVIFVGLFAYLIHTALSIFPAANFSVDSDLYFGEIAFNTFKLIIFYYILVAVIEETSKHFNFLQSSILHITSVKSGVLYAIFIALGFSLVENVLYLYNIHSRTGLSAELVQTYFFRSIFSVIVHVFCSSLIAYYFSRALLLYRGKDLSFPYLKIFLTGLLLSIFFHSIFDIALTLGFTVVIFLYFIGGYLYVSSIFYKED